MLRGFSRFDIYGTKELLKKELKLKANRFWRKISKAET